jgi:hypothetical protein
MLALFGLFDLPWWALSSARALVTQLLQQLVRRADRRRAARVRAPLAATGLIGVHGWRFCRSSTHNVQVDALHAVPCDS